MEHGLVFSLLLLDYACRDWAGLASLFANSYNFYLTANILIKEMRWITINRIWVDFDHKVHKPARLD